jgi:hypothetical protein
LLARRGLHAAASNLSIFSTEDLIRIAWAFLEVSDADLSALHASEVAALGRILATTEMSLHRWEHPGECTADAPSAGSHSDASVFSSFFGRPRINLPLLESAVDDDDDDDDVLGPFVEQSLRPKLRDLSVDPSTLCKAACNFQRLSSKHHHIKGGWVLTRVAIRLLSSKNARLMKECSIHDLVRLCEAAVLSDMDGHGRELIIGLFARQVVSVLNGALDEETRNDYSINVEAASSSELVTLIWALGELGVKSSPVGEGNKKMRLLFLESLVSDIDIKSLSLAALQRLIRGLVLMKRTPADLSFMLSVLRRILVLLSEVTSPEELCGIAESVGLFKESIKGMKMKNSHYSTTESSSSATAKVGECAEQIQEDELILSPLAEVTSNFQDLAMVSDELLVSIAAFAKGMANRLTAVQIRRLLTVYSLLPFKDDEMIELFASEVSVRMAMLEDLSKNHTLNVLLQDAARKSSHVQSVLFENAEKSFFDSMKNGFMSLFSSGSDESENNAQEKADESATTTEKIAPMIQGSIEATLHAGSRAQTDEATLKVSIDSVLRSLEESASFELGRALELIENYRRIEFSTGNRRSRYDRERRNDIAKRVLSRLLP